MAIMNNVSVWWHVVGAAAIVLILIFVPDQHQSFSYVFTERFNNSGFGGRQHEQLRVLLRDRAVRLPADAVHDHRLRRLGPPVGGDRRRRRRLRPRASGARSSTRRSAATSCCSAWCSRSRTPPTASRTTPASAAEAWPTSSPSDGNELGDVRPVHLGIRTVLLRDLVHDLGVPDDLRLQPRRCDPGLEHAGRT